VGLKLRAALLDAQDEVDPLTELLVFAADRAQHVRRVLRPALSAGQVVISDRYADATVAYQGSGRGFSPELISKIVALATEGLRPDLTLLFDLSVADSGARTRRRSEGKHKNETADRLDAENAEFHARVREAYLQLAAAEPERFPHWSKAQAPSTTRKRRSGRLCCRFSEAVGILLWQTFTNRLAEIQTLLMFDSITGNERAKQLLRRMLQEDRVPGALLLSGEEGIGKKLFAMELAKALNCRTRVGVDGCGNCPICKRISKINFPTSDEAEEKRRIFWTDHPDVGFLQPPTRMFHVVQMRSVEIEANFRPYEGNARVFLIDDADKLNDQSANALLKTLEEPPRTAYIILITSRPAMLLPTIRSRCQQIRFSPLTPAEIENHLLDTKLAKGTDARLRARCAAGSIGRALSDDIESYKLRREAMLSVLKALALTGDRLACCEPRRVERSQEQGRLRAKSRTARNPHPGCPSGLSGC
jgi:dTMP kinase